jgi:cytochrome P450
VQKGFARPRLNRLVPTILARTDAAIAGIAGPTSPSGRPVDLYPVGRDLILGVTLHALFGERTARRAVEFGDLFRRPQQFIEAPAIRQLPHPFPFTARARVRSDRRAIHRIIGEEIAERRRNPSGDPYDVLEAVVTDGTLPDNEICDQMATLIGAGFDTTAASLAWLLWCAVLEPGVWAALRAEADDVLGEPGSAPASDPEVLAALTAARHAVHESLRLHPAGVIGVRQLVDDLELGGCRIPARTMLAWSPHLTGRDAAVWTDPLRFDPDRHRDPTPEQRALQDQAWVPFGRGPHMCIGFALAQMELVLILARMAQQLDLVPVSSEVPDAVGLVVSRPAGGAPFVVTARDPGQAPPGSTSRNTS